ncbi:MAG: hypothetical protein O3A33_05975 [Chloroflexi bacterium]|nr:hypothetical protein [Chloroflexota bacterium]
MRSSLGIIAVFALAVAGAFTLALAQKAYAPPSNDNNVVSASTRDIYISDELDGPYGFSRELPLGEIQHLTIKGLVVSPDQEHISTIAPDGTSIGVNSSMQPGDSYGMYLSLNNSSAVPQSAELTVDAPQSVTIDVEATPGSAAGPEVSKVERNHWTIIYSGETQPGGPFDLTVSVQSSRFLSQEDGLVQIELLASEYIPQRPQLVGLVY